MSWLLCQPMGGQAPFRWLRHPIVGEPVGALPPEGWGLVIVRCREVAREHLRGGTGRWAGASGRTLSLVILLVEPVPAEFHGGKHAPPGSVRGAARMSRWREMDARRKTHKHKRAKPDRTHKGKGDPNPSPSATGPEIAWGSNFPNGDP